MEINNIYEKIVELEGACFSSDTPPPCHSCPFNHKCLSKMLGLAESIKNETRVMWALDELVEGAIFDDNEKYDR